MSNDSNRPHIGVGVIVWKGDHLLLGKRINSREKACWQFPGGHLELNETVSQCALREVREETGLEVQQPAHAGFSEEIFTIAGRHYITLFVSANYAGGEAEVMEADKCQCWQWFRYDNLPSPLFVPIINILKQVSDLSELRCGQDVQAGGRK